MSSLSAWGFSLRHLAAVVFVGGLTVVAGCGQKAEPDGKKDDSPGVRSTDVSSGGKTVTATPVSRSSSASPIKRDRLHQAFADAVRNADDPPPADAVRPPDETVTKKPVHRCLEYVRTHWDDVRFTTAEGKSIAHTARIETSLGTIEVALFHEQAPNHVRNFVVLARGGYYDKLFFERVLHDKAENGVELHRVEGGCPLGNGSTGTGSIGYWLKEEFTPPDKMGHDEGTLGAVRGEEADSAATRFYITLNKAPFLDGNYTIYGKVVQGLDVLRKMGQVPIVNDDEGNSRPETPIVINKVTIVTKEQEAGKK